MRLIYLASPYTHGNPAVRYARYSQTKCVVAAYTMLRLHVISPIVHFHPVADAYDLPTDFEFWRDHNLTCIRRCDELHVIQLPGWEISKGVQEEHAFAKSLAKPIQLVPSPEESTAENWIKVLQGLKLGSLPPGGAK